MALSTKREMGPPRLPFLFSLANKASHSRAMAGRGAKRGRMIMFVRTDRLFLRPAWLEDAPELARAIGDKMVVRNLARVPWPYTEDHAREWIARGKAAFLP